MRKLTQGQENFARLYVELGNAAEAYRQAYPKSKNWKDQSVRVNASKLLADANISLTVSNLRQSAADAAKITLESHLKELELLRDMAKEQGNIGAAIQAETVRGKHSGVATASKVEVSGSFESPPKSIRELV